MSEIGFIYVLQNDGMEGVYKIGFTLRSPHSRAEELSAPSGVPCHFSVAFYVECYCPRETEQQIHFDLSEHRICESREFFRLRLSAIVASILRRADRLSEWGGEFYRESFEPGSVWKDRPAYFEACHHDKSLLDKISMKAGEEMFGDIAPELEGEE